MSETVATAGWAVIKPYGWLKWAGDRWVEIIGPVDVRVVKTFRLDGNTRPAGESSVWRRLRLIDWQSTKLAADNPVAEHRDMIGEGDEGGLAESGADDPSGFIVGELDHYNKIAVDDGLTEINVTVGPDFNRLGHDSSSPALGCGETVAGDCAATTGKLRGAE